MKTRCLLCILHPSIWEKVWMRWSYIKRVCWLRIHTLYRTFFQWRRNTDLRCSSNYITITTFFQKTRNITGQGGLICYRAEKTKYTILNYSVVSTIYTLVPRRRGFSCWSSLHLQGILVPSFYCSNNHFWNTIVEWLRNLEFFELYTSIEKIFVWALLSGTVCPLSIDALRLSDIFVWCLVNRVFELSLRITVELEFLTEHFLYE